MKQLLKFVRSTKNMHVFALNGDGTTTIYVPKVLIGDKAPAAIEIDIKALDAIPTPVPIVTDDKVAA